MANESPERAASKAETARLMPLRVGLYILTLLSAAAALFLEPPLAAAVGRGAVSGRWLFLPMAVYGVFLAVYATDRIWLVRHRRYPSGKAFFQVAFGLVFASLLLPETIQDFKATRHSAADRLLGHADPSVREAAVLAIGFRGFGREQVDVVLEKLADDNREVRAAAAEVLSRWSGKPVEEVEELRQWARTLSSVSTSSTVKGTTQ